MDTPISTDPPGTSPQAAPFPRWGAVQETGTESLDPVRAVLLPGVEESPAEYLARLKNLHARAGALIAKLEERRPARSVAAEAERPRTPALAAPAPARTADEPAPWPVRDRRSEIERRIGASNRRLGNGDRRARGQVRGAIAVADERRAGPRDRRTGATDRRRGIDRRRIVRNLPWEGGLRLDRTALIWVIQVAAWVTIVVLALVYGLGTG